MNILVDYEGISKGAWFSTILATRKSGTSISIAHPLPSSLTPWKSRVCWLCGWAGLCWENRVVSSFMRKLGNNHLANSRLAGDRFI